MKKILTFLLLIVLGASLIGCEKIDFGFPDNLDPTENNEDLPISIVVESVDKTHKLYVDSSLQLKATVYPNTVTEPVVFISSNEEIATVNQEGIVTGVKAGTVKITARISKESSLSNVTTVEGYIVLTIMEKIVQIKEVEIIGDDSIYIDDITKLNVVKNPINATYYGTWSTSNDSIAKIDSNGRLIGLAFGTVDVTYYVNEEIKDIKTITILERQGTPTNLEIIVRDLLEVGEVVQAYINVTPIGSLNDVVWSVDKTNIASIDSDGKITGISQGVVQITAKANDLTTNYEINIIDNTLDNTNLEQNIVDLVRTKKGSVLGVSNYQLDNEGDLVKKSLGSGFIYKVEFILKDGSTIYNIEDLRSFSEVEYYKYYLITNRHVVEGSDALKIYMHEEDIEIEANLIQYDDKVDISIVTFNYYKYLKPLKLADSDNLVAGRFAIAIGNPSGFEFSSTATFGLISHPKRYLSTDTNSDGVNDWDAEYIQHDVAINPGNSGGPLFNLQGEVIGINTLKYVSDNIEGMGFSIPINVAKDLIPYLEDGEKPNRALLGVTATAVKDVLMDPKSEIVIPEGIENGLYVIDVVLGSVAELGGVLPGDIIVRFNGIDLTSVTILRTQLNQIIVNSNTEIEVVVYRNNEYVTLTLVF